MDVKERGEAANNRAKTEEAVKNWSERGVQRVSLRNSAGDFLNLFSIGG